MKFWKNNFFISDICVSFLLEINVYFFVFIFLGNKCLIFKHCRTKYHRRISSSSWVFSKESNKSIDNLVHYLFRGESIEDTINAHRECLYISLTLTLYVFMLRFSFFTFSCFVIIPEHSILSYNSHSTDS